MPQAAHSADLIDNRYDVGDLPRLRDLSISQVTNDGLVDAEAPSSAGHSRELPHEASSHDDTGHLGVTLLEHLLHLVPKVGHGSERIAPHLFLRIAVGRGEIAGCVNDGVRMKPRVEVVDIATIARSQPLLDDGTLLIVTHEAIVELPGGAG